MKQHLLLASGALAAFMGTACAQNVVTISPDDTILVERYVREIPAPPVIEEHMTLRPGSVIPEGVPLTRFEKLSQNQKPVVIKPLTFVGF